MPPAEIDLVACARLLLKIKKLVGKRASMEAECVLLRELAANEEVKRRKALHLVKHQYRALFSSSFSPILVYLFGGASCFSGTHALDHEC